MYLFYFIIKHDISVWIWNVTIFKHDIFILIWNLTFLSLSLSLSLHICIVNESDNLFFAQLLYYQLHQLYTWQINVRSCIASQYIGFIFDQIAKLTAKKSPSCYKDIWNIL